MRLDLGGIVDAQVDSLRRCTVAPPRAMRQRRHIGRALQHMTGLKTAADNMRLSIYQVHLAQMCITPCCARTLWSVKQL